MSATKEVVVRCSFTKMEDVVNLVPHPSNPNKHGDAQVALLAKIIRHQGWRAPITISKRSGFIVSGHGRLQAALLLQVEQVPVDEQDFATEADEWAHLVADNRIAELAETDGAMLKDILGDLDTGAFDMDLTGFDNQELERVINSFGDHDESSGREPITPEVANATLCERFGVPPFSVLDARQGYWQDRKRAWLALGIKSEIGRGGAAGTSARAKPGEAPTYRQIAGGVGGGLTVLPAVLHGPPAIIPLANAGTVPAES